MMKKEDREDLLKTFDTQAAVSPEQVLALKADLAIPWNKLRVMRRYVSCSSGVKQNNTNSL